MKKIIRAAVITMLFVMLFSVCAFASDKSEVRAIKKQIKLLESGIKTHNYSKVKKVVIKPYSEYCDFKRIDKLVGKKFLKTLSDQDSIKVKYVEIHGKKANVILTAVLCDCSTLYFQTHKNLYLNNKHTKNNFKKELNKVKKGYVGKNVPVLSLIKARDVEVTMVKNKNKWVFESDPSALLFDMYSCGYLYFAQTCSNIYWGDW